MIAARGETLGRSKAPCKARVGSLLARRVTIASLKTLLITPRNRRADSRRSDFSICFNISNSSAEVISAIGRTEMAEAKLINNQRFFLIVEAAASCAARLLRYSSATSPNVQLAAVRATMSSRRFCTEGSEPLARRRLASSRFSLASAKLTTGKGPIDSNFSLVINRYFKRQSLEPLG
jgi:hypothetical protein